VLAFNIRKKKRQENIRGTIVRLHKQRNTYMTSKYCNPS
jgi:hypothetical protein